MKHLKLFLLILFVCMSCTTTKIVRVRDTSHFTAPVKPYIPKTNITTTRELIEEYNRAVKIILEHEFWYDLNINTNYYTSQTNL